MFLFHVSLGKWLEEKVPDVGVSEGIDAVRLLLPRVWFDEQKCATGLKHLSEYRREWNKGEGCWGSRPHHNNASHAADAFRMLAIGLNLVIGADEINDRKAELLWREANGYSDRSGLTDESHALYTGTMY